MSSPPIHDVPIESRPRFDSGSRLTIDQILDSQPISARQILIVVLCFCVATLDGLDLAIVGFLAPAIRGEWHIGPGDLALLFSGGLVGYSVGSLIAGPTADTIGRKKVLIIAVSIFGFTCASSAFVRSFQELLILRVLTGIGLGAAAPNAITLTSEFCPARKRSFLITTMFCGFTLGSAAGGTLVVPLLLPHVGWRGVFVVIGALPLVLVPLLVAYLPESLKYLIHRGAKWETIEPLLRKVSPGLATDAQAIISEDEHKGSPLAQLFTGMFRTYTPLLWFCYFLSLLVIYLFTNWLPIVIVDSGLPISAASIVVGLFQIGAAIGALGLGYFMDRYRPETVLSTSYLVGAIGIAVMGFAYSSQILLAICMFLTGACVSGGMTGANALTSQVYPTSSRATGVGWALGIGRIGSIIGSAAGAWIFSKAFKIQTAFLIAAVPAVCIGLALAMLGRIRNAASVSR